MIEEINQMQDPKINEKSEQLLARKNESKMKVEDRLLKMGQMWKDKKELQQKAIAIEFNDRA